MVQYSGPDPLYYVSQLNVSDWIFLSIALLSVYVVGELLFRFVKSLIGAGEVMFVFLLKMLVLGTVLSLLFPTSSYVKYQSLAYIHEKVAIWNLFFDADSFLAPFLRLWTFAPTFFGKV